MPLAAPGLCLLLILGSPAVSMGTDRVIELDKLKLSDSGAKQRLSLSIKSPMLLFPGNGSMNPRDSGALLEIISEENLAGASFFAPPYASGPDPGWSTSGGPPKRKHKFKHRGAPDGISPIKKIIVTENGRLKIIGASTTGAMLSAATRVFVRVTFDTSRTCSMISVEDILKLSPGARWFARAASGTASLSNCDDPILAGCGDGDLDPGEECDYGAPLSDPNCRVDCTQEQCGDGILDPSDDCDDGNNIDGDGCPADCAICGNHSTASAEDCDPPYTIGGDANCAGDCSFAVCGDGVIEANEACENGPGLDTACPGACGTAGALPCTCPDTCGNGVVDAGESCDPEAAEQLWSCPSNPYGVQCSRSCSCCNDNCGSLGLGCCEAATCIPSPGGNGVCVNPGQCIVDEGCGEPFTCDEGSGFCCLPANPSEWCAALGQQFAACCSPATCQIESSLSGFGLCCLGTGLACTDSGECCSGDCGVSGLCECLGNGATCWADAGCCSGNCDAGTCQP